jgi:hypothetical protein
MPPLGTAKRTAKRKAKKVYITVAFDKQGKIIHAVRNGKKVHPKKRKKAKVRLVGGYKMGHHAGSKHGSDPCCFWDPGANEEVCWC